MNMAWAFLKRDFLIASSYRLSFAVKLFAVAIPVPLCYFAGRVVPAEHYERLVPYGGDVFGFLLIGMGVLQYLNISLRSFNQIIRESQMMGTLEIMFLSPASITQLVLYSSLWVYAFTTFRFVLLLLLGAALGLDFGSADVVAALVILIMAVPGFASLGIFSASLIIVIKRGKFITSIVTFASLIFGGVLFPIAQLPPSLQVAAQLLPITHALEGMRRAVFSGDSLVALWPQVGALALFTLVLLPISLTTFRLALRRTKVTGTLSQY